MASYPAIVVKKSYRSLVIALSLLFFITSPIDVEGFSQNFLEKDAGIAAFFTFTGPTNLSSNLLRNQFRVVEMTTSEYLVGSVVCEGFEGDSAFDAKVLVHNDGWVVAFFPKLRPLSQVVYLKMDKTTRLDLVLKKIAFALDIESYTTTYTHFQYQEATKIFRVGKATSTGGEFSVDVRLPSSNTYYDQAWHLRAQNDTIGTWLKLDQKLLGQTPYGFGGTSVIDGIISSADMVTNARHVFTLGLSNPGWTSGAGYGELDLLASGEDGLILTAADWLEVIPLQPAPEGLIEAASDVPFFLETYLPITIR